MLSEIKNLDSDMQMLVYENYNRFISATDTVRTMKSNVDGMDTSMQDLEKVTGLIHLFNPNRSCSVPKPVSHNVCSDTWSMDCTSAGQEVPFWCSCQCVGCFRPHVAVRSSIIAWTCRPLQVML